MSSAWPSSSSSTPTTFYGVAHDRKSRLTPSPSPKERKIYSHLIKRVHLWLYWDRHLPFFMDTTSTFSSISGVIYDTRKISYERVDRKREKERGLPTGCERGQMSETLKRKEWPSFFIVPYASWWNMCVQHVPVVVVDDDADTPQRDEEKERDDSSNKWCLGGETKKSHRSFPQKKKFQISFPKKDHMCLWRNSTVISRSCRRKHLQMDKNHCPTSSS